MKVILTVDPIRNPLTGIGKYAWELASRFPENPEITDLRYLAHGQWVNLAELQKRIQPKTVTTTKLAPATRLRRRIFNSSIARRAYQEVSKALYRLRLKNFDDYLFHSPHYLIPNSNLKNIITIHDLSTFKDPSWHPEARRKTLNKLLPDSIERSSLIFTDSVAIKNEVQEYFGLPDQKVIAIPLGVDDIFEPKTESEIKPILCRYGLSFKGYTLCVATIEPRKNISRLIKAYSKLSKKLQNHWPLVLIGEPGWNSKAIHEQIAAVKAQGWLKYIGFVPENDLPALYAGCRLFAYPSLYEGFGFPIAEAMASGVPTLTSNISSMPEVANGAAYLIDPEDEEQLSYGLEYCLQDEAWQERSITTGLLQAKKLSWETCVTKTLSAYRLAIANT